MVFILVLTVRILAEVTGKKRCSLQRVKFYQLCPAVFPKVNWDIHRIQYIRNAALNPNMEQSKITRFMASQPVRNDIDPEGILSENYFVTHKIHRLVVMRTATKALPLVPVNILHNIYSGWSNTVGIDHPLNPLLHENAASVRRSFHTRIPPGDALCHLLFVKLIDPLKIIRLEELMITLIVTFENAVISAAILVKFFGCNSLQVFNGGRNSHQVGFEFGDIDQKGVWRSHRGHKTDLFKNNTVNLFKNDILFG